MTAQVLIIEPSLKGYAGHSYNGVKSLKTLAEHCGLQSTLLISRKAPPDLMPDSHVARIFKKSPYSRKSSPGAPGFRSLKSSLYLSLARFLRSAPARYRCIVLRTASQELVAAIADLIHAGLLPSDVHIIMWLLFEPAWNLADPSAYRCLHEMEYKRAFKRLAAVLDHPDRLHIFAETQGMDSAYTKLLQREVSICRPPDLTQLQGRPATGTAPSHPRIAMLGNPAGDKGYELLAGAIGILGQRGVPADFQIHAAAEGLRSGSEPTFIQQLREALPDGGLTTKNLSDDEYLERLRQTDLMLLPYKLPAYATRGSGIYLEASLLGIPMIVPAGARFAAEALAQNRAVAFDRHTSLSLANAIEFGLKNLPSLKENAIKAAQESARHDAHAGLKSIFQEMLTCKPAIKRRRSWRQILQGAVQYQIARINCAVGLTARLRIVRF